MYWYFSYFIGCGGYVNGAGTISSANWGNELLDDDEPAAQEYPDECFWFIEARHAGETILLKKNASLVHQKLTLDSPIVVSLQYIPLKRITLILLRSSYIQHVL